MLKLAERTITPPPVGASLSGLQDALSTTAHVRLVADDGTTAEVPAEVAQALQGIVAAMADGKAVSVESVAQMLSTQEAADLIGVSRPTLVKYLDEGRLPSTRPGTHRYVRLDDLLAFEESFRRERRAILDEMTRDETRDGLRSDGFPVTRR
jgi:excisionase family DNA binding protein